MSTVPWRGLGAIALLAAVLALPACGDDEDAEAGQLSTEVWVARADRFCTDGTQEATALPLPGRPQQVAADAVARAEIVATARDGLLTLGRPEDIDGEDLDAYLAELGADMELLAQIAEGTESGGEYAQLDESAGLAASELGLAGCAAFANAIARTP